MLKVDMDMERRSVGALEAKGSCKVMAAEIAGLIGGVYHQLKSMDEQEAERLKSMLLFLLTPDGPVWNERPNMMGFGCQVPK